MKRLAAAVAVVVVLAACGQDGGGSSLRAGAGTALLRIPVGHPHAGYLQSDAIGAPHPPDDPGSAFAELFPATRAMQSPPRAKALVLESRGRRLVLAQLDAIFVTAELTARVRELAHEQLGVDLAGQLVLHATHTHGAAGRFSSDSLRPTLLAGEPASQRAALAHGIDTFSPESTDRLASGVVEAIGEAFRTLRPARFGWSAGVNETASRDRRCHDDWLTGKGDRDSTVTVLRVDEAGGAPIAVLFHFAMHGTLYDHDSRSLSVDAPGHAEYAVEAQFDWPVVAMYLQGAAASASPNGDPRGHSGSQAMERVAWDLARTVVELHAATETRSSLDLQVHTRKVPLDAKRLGYRGSEFHDDGAMLCNFLDSTCRDRPRDPNEIQCLGRAVPGGGKYQTWLTAVRLGDLAILTVPGEPSPAVGRALVDGAKAQGFAHAIPLGYSQDHDGYVLFADDWLSGGSETHITFWGWRYADYVVRESLATLEQLNGEGFVRAELVVPAKRPQWAYTPIAATASLQAPAVIEEPPQVAERITEIAFAMRGGDPALGTPEVRLQRDTNGAWSDVLVSGWIPVSNLRGPELPTFYEASPSWREDPEAAARTHVWRVIYEPPRDLPVGAYRFTARGETIVEGATQAYVLHSQPFVVVPSSAMRIDAAVVGDALEATLLYPVRKAVYHPDRANDGWQIGGFRAVDPRFTPAFVPVLDGQAAGPILADGTPIEVAFQPREAPVGAFAPGEGPGFRAKLPPGAANIVIPAGALQDAWGNRLGGEAVRILAGD